MAEAMKAIHFLVEQGRVAAIPAIADEQDDRPTAHHAPRPLVIKALDGVANTRAARPILHRGRHLMQGFIDVLVAQLARYIGQAGGKDKDFYALAQSMFEAIEKLQ